LNSALAVGQSTELRHAVGALAVNELSSNTQVGRAAGVTSRSRTTDYRSLAVG
jgi:hypothetical protein